MAGREELYRRLDVLLAERARDYPERREPTWSALEAALRAVGDALRDSGTAPGRDALSAATELVDDPVFVVGYYKSGTTLLLSLLDGHPDIQALPGESKHFTGFLPENGSKPREEQVELARERWIRVLITPAGVPPFWTLGRPWETGVDLYERFCGAFAALAQERHDADLLGVAAAALHAVRLDAGLAGRPARLWAEKTPTQELRVAEMVAAYPRARFLHIVRDPRSTFAAIRGFARAMPMGDAAVVATELARSLAAARAQREELGEERYLVIRYEDLVAEPAAEMERVAATLGVPFTESLLRPTVAGAAQTANSSRPERRVSGLVHGESVDRSGDLDSRASRVLAAMTGGAAAAFGYDLGAASGTVRFATRARLKTRALLGR